GAEGREIRLFEIARAGVDVEGVAFGLRAAVDREVFAGGDRFGVLGVIALHAGDEGYAHAAGEVRVFAVGLLAAAPAWVAEDIDIRRPEGEAVEDTVVAFLLGVIVLGAGFGGDDVAHRVQHLRVPGGGHADGLREDSR